MMEDKFDIKALQSRISEVKKETEESTEFSLEFLECLLKRHDLANILHEEHEFDDTPDEVNEALKKGELPKKEDLLKMTTDALDYLIKDCVYMCGLGAISWYGDNLPQYQELDPKPFDEIIAMPDISAGHHTASYIIAGFTLLFADIPSRMLIQRLTNDFDSSDKQLEENMEFYNEICLMILQRYQEDLEYYGNQN
jgi:hypothetical protein